MYDVNRLSTLQAEFQAALQDTTQSDILSHLVADGPVPIERRLHIYQHAYRARMEEAGAANFPMCQRLLGELAFAQQLQAFLKQHPSTYRNMRWLGQALPAYWQQSANVAPGLAALARFEWLLGIAFDAEDTPSISLDALIAIPAEQWASMRMSLHASVHLETAELDVISLWQALNAGEKKRASKLQKHTHPLSYMVWRQDLTAHFKSLSSQEYAAVLALQQGTSFGAICDQLSTTMEAEQATQMMAHLVLLLIESQAVTAIQT